MDEKPLSGGKLAKKCFALEHFVTSSVLNTIAHKNLNFKSNLAKEDDLDAVIKAPNIDTFNNNFFRDKDLAGDQDLNNFKTSFTSQVPKYLGFGGLRENIPFMNLVTNGCRPTTTPSKGI